MDIIINNNKYKISKNKKWNILQLCNVLHIKIPVFCYHEKLNVAGNCRMCLIELEKSPKPIVACATPLLDKMVIFTETVLVKKARENVLELLLLNHPLDCPICDQAGECDLQENTKDFSSDRSRNFYTKRRGVEDKPLGNIIKTIMTRCIHCTRCVRFIEEFTNDDSLHAIGRGSSMEIGTYINKFVKTELSGNLVDICPVGALTSKTYAFGARPWELKKIQTYDFSDGIVSPINLSIRFQSSQQKHLKNYNFNVKTESNEQILRVLPFFDENSIEFWIHDKTRFSYDGLFLNRLSTPAFYLSKNIEMSNDCNNNILNFENWLNILSKNYYDLKNHKENKKWFFKNILKNKNFSSNAK